MGWKWLCEETGPCRGGFTHRAWPLGMEVGRRTGWPRELAHVAEGSGETPGAPQGGCSKLAEMFKKRLSC